MPERTIRVASRTGLHARPAKIFVQEVIRLGVPVKIGTGDGRRVPAGSMLGVPSLDVLAELLATDLDAAGADAGGTRDG